MKVADTMQHNLIAQYAMRCQVGVCHSLVRSQQLADVHHRGVRQEQHRGSFETNELGIDISMQPFSVIRKPQQRNDQPASDNITRYF